MTTVGYAAAAAVFDRKWTEEAVCNLLDNAVKYTPPGGQIILRAVSYELFSRIDVTDNGPGIPEEEQTKVFGRFYRGKAIRPWKAWAWGCTLSGRSPPGRAVMSRCFPSPGRARNSPCFCLAVELADRQMILCGRRGGVDCLRLGSPLNLSKLLDFRKNLERL